MLFRKNRQNIEDVNNINSLVDFTLLDPRATNGDIEKLCDIAYKNGYYSVCVNPTNVRYAKKYITKKYKDRLKVCSVIGFPLGANSVETKIFEIKDCIYNGVDEFDVVVNIGKVKQGDFVFVKDEIKRIRKITKHCVLKIIIETCYLTENEIVKLSKICSQCNVDFIKTSTGFGTGGADIEIVKLIYNAVKGGCKIKASGGIKTRQQAIDFVNAGVRRIGTSHII